MDSKIFSNVTRLKFNALNYKLHTLDLDMKEDKGVLEGKFGIKLSYDFEENEETLKVEILEKSFLIPASTIWNEIDKALA